MTRHWQYCVVAKPYSNIHGQKCRLLDGIKTKKKKISCPIELSKNASFNPAVYPAHFLTGMKSRQRKNKGWMTFSHIPLFHWVLQKQDSFLLLQLLVAYLLYQGFDRAAKNLGQNKFVIHQINDCCLYSLSLHATHLLYQDPAKALSTFTWVQPRTM